MNEAKRPAVQTILVMDSRKTSLAVRQQNFTGAWSQVYKAGDFYLDLRLKPDSHKVYLQGYIVADAGQFSAIQGTARLHNDQTPLSIPSDWRVRFGWRCPPSGSTAWRSPCQIRSFAWTTSKSSTIPAPLPLSGRRYPDLA